MGCEMGHGTWGREKKTWFEMEMAIKDEKKTKASVDNIHIPVNKPHLTAIFSCPISKT